MLVARGDAVLPGVLKVRLSDDQRAPVSFEQQLDVRRLLHRLLVVVPDNLHRHIDISVSFGPYYRL